MPNNVNVGFKRGTQAALDTIIAGSGNRYTEGTFYLTSDTDKLYFAQSATELVQLNKHVNVVTSAANLPTSGVEDGTLYYVTSGNILCIYDADEDAKYIQLNPDTDTVVSSFTVATTSYTSTATTNGSTSATGVSVGGTIQSSGPHAVTTTANFNIVGTGLVSVTTGANKEVVISVVGDNTDHTYTLAIATETSAGKINFTSLYDNTTTTITLTTASNGMTGTKFASDNSGTVTLTIPKRPVATADLVVSSAGLFKVDARTADNAAAPTSTGITPTIVYGASGSTASAVFVQGATGNPSAVLDVYTTTQVNNLITSAKAAFDAMEFKGGVNSTAGLVSSGTNATKGSTYIATADFDLPAAMSATDASVNVQKGDVLVGEGSDGNLLWTVVPSGNDQIVSGSISDDGKTITVSGSRNTSEATTIAQATFSSGTGITVSGSKSGNATTITVSHASPGAAATTAGVTTATSGGTQSAASSASGSSTLVIPAITSIQYDSLGHVTSVTAGNYTVIDSHSWISSITTTTTANASGVSLSYNFVSTDGETSLANAAFIVGSGSALSVTTAMVGEIPAVQFDLLWGSF